MSGGAHGHRGGGGRAVPPEHSVLVDSAALSVLAKEPLSSQDFRLLIEYGAGRLGCCSASIRTLRKPLGGFLEADQVFLGQINQVESSSSSSGRTQRHNAVKCFTCLLPSIAVEAAQLA